MKYLFFLGNGFSLDLIQHLKRQEDILLTNLFAHGDRITWPPYNRNAFISFRNTPNLWILGVRPTNTSEKNNQIVENVITCANAYYLKPSNSKSFGMSDKRSIYIKAYKELVVYLKYLFVWFDSDVSIAEAALDGWTWADFLVGLNDDPIKLGKLMLLRLTTICG